MKKSAGKNPRAVALGRLGGLVRSEAKQRANRENGRKGGLARSRRKTLACHKGQSLQSRYSCLAGIHMTVRKPKLILLEVLNRLVMALVNHSIPELLLIQEQRSPCSALIAAN